MEKKKNVIRFFIDFYRRFSIPWWLYLLSAACGILYAEVTIKVTSLLIRVNKGELYNSVIIGYVLLTVLNAVIVFAQNVLQEYGSQRIILRARNVLWNKFLHFPARTVEENQPSSLISAMTSETEEASQMINIIFMAVASVYGFVRACIVLYEFQSELAAYMLLLIPIAILVFYIVGKLQYIMMRKRYESIEKMTTFFSEHLSAGKYVKACAMEEKELESGFLAINFRYRADIYYTFMSELQVFSNSIYSNLSTIFIAVGGSHLIQKGRMELTGINTFSNYMQKVDQYLAENLTHYQNMMGAKGSLAHVDRLLNLECENPNVGEEWKECEDRDIIFEHVNFGYAEDRQVIYDLSIRIPAGKATAIIGDNGCGKSTVMKLIQGFYLPDSGTITVAGNEVGKVKMSDLRERFSYVLQTNPLFAGSIRDNMVYGVDRAVTEKEIKNLAKITCIDEFVEKLPDGYDTVLGESGSQLSGGQRQRIAIARSLMMDPEYLILDEAGASLDYDTYKQIYKAITEERKNKTMIFIAHDMKEVMEADYIIVLNKGRFEASGTHAQLLASSRTYQDYLRKIAV